jgi:hypothetical protein
VSFHLKVQSVLLLYNVSCRYSGLSICWNVCIVTEPIINMKSHLWPLTSVVCLLFAVLCPYSGNWLSSVSSGNQSLCSWLVLSRLLVSPLEERLQESSWPPRFVAVKLADLLCHIVTCCLSILYCAVQFEPQLHGIYKYRTEIYMDCYSIITDNTLFFAFNRLPVSLLPLLEEWRSLTATALGLLLFGV